MSRVRAALNRFPGVHLRHSAHSSASEPGVLVAVAPAVHGALDKTSLAAQRRVQLSKSPSDRVALGLVYLAVASVLVLGAAGSGVNAVLRLELGRELVRVDRLNIAADGVLHLDAVARVFKRDPLNAVLILSNNQRRSGRDGARRRVGVDTARSRSCRGVQSSAVLGVLLMLHGSRLGLLELQRHLGLRLHLAARAVGHLGLVLLRLVLGHVLLLLLGLRRHHHVGLRRHGLVRLGLVLRVGRLLGLRLHRRVVGLRRLVVHVLLERLRRRLAVDASVLVMLRRRGYRRGRVRLRCVVGHGRVRWSRHLSGGHHVGLVCYSVVNGCELLKLSRERERERRGKKTRLFLGVWRVFCARLSCGRRRAR